MSHVSSITMNAYPYRSTLAEVDTNGDGIVSQQELAASQRPGLLRQDTSDEGESGASSTLSSVMAVLLKVHANDSMRTAQVVGSAANAGAAAGNGNTQDDGDLETSMAVYRNTYGLYDLDNVA